MEGFGILSCDHEDFGFANVNFIILELCMILIVDNQPEKLT